MRKRTQNKLTSGNVSALRCVLLIDGGLRGGVCEGGGRSNFMIPMEQCTDPEPITSQCDIEIFVEQSESEASLHTQNKNGGEARGPGEGKG